MSDRDKDRSRDRPSQGGHHPTNSASGGALSFLPNLFGRRQPTVATSRQASEAMKLSDRRASLEPPTSPKSRLKPLPAGEKRSTSPAPHPPFDLKQAMGLMGQKEDISTPELVEILKATAVWLANLLLDGPGGTVSDDPVLSTAEVRGLYRHAIRLSNPRGGRNVRIAAKRLLAALISVAPPGGGGSGFIAVDLPDPINTSSLYKVITSSAIPAVSGPSISVDEIHVEVGALKALTRNGVEVDGTEGIVGWLVRTMQDMMDDWILWCSKREEEEDDIARKRITPFAPIKPASPAEAVSEIIELLAAIVSAHAPLFSFNDLRRIVEPMFAFFWRGALAESKTIQPSLLDSTVFTFPQRRDSPASSVTTTPAAPSVHALGMEPGLRKSLSLKRTGQTGSRSSASSPSSKPTARQASGSDSIKSPLLLASPPPPADRSPSPGPLPISRSKWSRPISSFTHFFETLTKSVTIPTEVFKEAVAVACLVLGQDPDEGLEEAEVSAKQLVQLVLSQAAGRRGENAVRMVLEGTAAEELHIEPLKDMMIDRCATRGAIIASHSLLGYLDSAIGSDTPAICAMASLTPSLRAAESTSRFGKDKIGSQHDEWEAVDTAILGLLQTHFARVAVAQAVGDGRLTGDAWSEGQAACEILEGFVPIVTASQGFNLSELRSQTASPTMAETESEYRAWMDRKVAEGVKPSLLLPLFESVLHHLPRAIAHLHSSASSGPNTPFYHPLYIDLLGRLGSHLDEEDSHVMIDYYEKECLCLPFTTGWTDNIWKLIKAFFKPSMTAFSIPQRKIARLLFTDIYSFTQDLPEYRVELVDKVIVPFLQQYLPILQDDEFEKEALGVLVSAAVVETFERDEERRQIRASKAVLELQEEDASPEASKEVTDATFAGSFNTIRALIASIAHIPCRDEMPSGYPISPPMSEAPSSSSLSRSASIKGKETSLRAFRGSISPPVRSRELPSISSIAPPPEDPVQSPMTPGYTHEHHADCRSIYAVTSLIAIFTKLCFTPSYHFTQATSAIRMPASFRSIVIYRDLLGLLYPMTDDRTRHPNTPTQVKIPARCPRARIIILEWLMRLRADKHHRIYVRKNIEEAALPFAAMLRRTRETEADGRAAEAEEARRRSRPSQQARQIDEERGRALRSQETSTRSRSRSKAPVVKGVDHSYTPLWILPQETLFEVPPDELSSEIMTVYDPHHPALQNPKLPPIDGVWLPISQYVRVLNGILRGHDWELVSYVLCFLPLQLRNKLFFHGRRAVAEVRALLRVLAEGVLGVDGNWEKRYNVPTFIKRVDINSIAYQSLSILIAYRGTLTRHECDQLVQAFADGLQGKKELAKPCLQAMTLCIFELEQYVGRHLLVILDRMVSIVSTTALAIYVLEFLIALGHNGSLYRNFTDEQYRRVFHVAIDYITIHNARSDEPIDLSKSREDYTLSQHVIGLAYYSIYIWFLALKLPQRPNLVPEITRKLLQGRSKRVIVDEMAEVCFDWLSRYTYGNADPRPASSFLTEVVMKDTRESEAPKSLSWLLGGAIVNVTSHSRSGWATITTTRPTGSTSVVCKLENVPLLELGESNADLSSLPGFLMANRAEIMKGSGELDIEKPDILAQTKSTVPAPEGFDVSAQHGFIWSGATPSQRRKDVIIQPSYIALQLLSSYPNQSLETPRGRLIPMEEKFQRTLRGIHNTPVIDTVKIAVLYCAPGQTTEVEILGNIDGSPLYLDFLSGLGRLIRLKGQVDVFVGGLNRENDSDGEYAYAWWDDFDQVVFHTPTMMPNHPNQPNHDHKKRLVGNDYVKIVYNESGRDFEFGTIKTAWNFINIVISPLTLGEGTITPEHLVPPTEDGWPDWDREEWFKVDIQRVAGIPEFGPLGEGKLVSRRSLPIVVRQLAHLANDLAARYTHIRDASDAASAEYITSWRSRLRAIARLRDMMPKFDLPEVNDEAAREELRRDFTRQFSYRPPAPEKPQ